VRGGGDRLLLLIAALVVGTARFEWMVFAVIDCSRRLESSISPSPASWSTA
jgi:hypothetical protein